MLASVEISCRKFFAAGGSGFDVMIVSSAGCAEIALRGFFFILTVRRMGVTIIKRLHLLVTQFCFVCLLIM